MKTENLKNLTIIIISIALLVSMELNIIQFFNSRYTEERYQNLCYVTSRKLDGVTWYFVMTVPQGVPSWQQVPQPVFASTNGSEAFDYAIKYHS